MADSNLLNDRDLTLWLQSSYPDIPFISTELQYEEHGRTTTLISAIKELDSSKALIQQKETVSDLWFKLMSKAIVYLKFKDERELYHDDQDYGVEKLRGFFNRFREFEPVLYGAEEEGYRDHMAHMLSVFLAGDYLIRKHLGFDIVNVGDENLPESQRVKADEKEAMWCIMALTHDLGIPLEKMVHISPKAEAMLKEYGIYNVQPLSYPSLRSCLDDFAIKVVCSDLRELSGDKEKGNQEFITHVQAKYFMKFTQAYEESNHGIMGCLVLLKNLVFFLETDCSFDSYKPLTAEDARQFLIRRSILRAIASHSNENIYHLRLLEFPFLLTIFDELHEWGRPRFRELFEQESSERIVSVVKLDRANIHYVVRYVWNDGNSEIDHLVREEMRGYFIKKCEKIKRILRSAVDGKRRDFSLILEVLDDQGGKKQHFKLLHTNPQNIHIYLNEEEITWLQLIKHNSSVFQGKLKP